jgi:hypothetical protein
MKSEDKICQVLPTSEGISIISLDKYNQILEDKIREETYLRLKRREKTSLGI